MIALRRCSQACGCHTSPQCTITDFLVSSSAAQSVSVYTYSVFGSAWYLHSQASLPDVAEHTVPLAPPATDEPLLAHSFHSSPRTWQADGRSIDM